VADTVPWTKRKKLLLIETIVFLACILGGILIVFTGHGASHKLEGAAILIVALVIHLILQLTYFKQVLPEIRRQRAGRLD
jgi:lysylphosphatidylglycerol synthetase-like protein (DUF2156 family)